jgi:hypothetical protein
MTTPTAPIRPADLVGRPVRAFSGGTYLGSTDRVTAVEFYGSFDERDFYMVTGLYFQVCVADRYIATATVEPSGTITLCSPAVSS